ncbi:hypothetical protein J437_LFUL001371 [Ladona fulva]|uniref:Uncharacterized protein n=1 Tax=Ladona fulva TaxID=123851 RepID=A0A8K0NWD9_LADFU|nr:hypothetical protein J437_LFUL001371 [Ladona fulva]
MIEDLKNKLIAAEQLCEELMDENKEIKKEKRDLEEEMEEMQDNFSCETFMISTPWVCFYKLLKVDNVMGHVIVYLQAQNLRQKLSRVEDDNESLVAQLKRMAAKSRSKSPPPPLPPRQDQMPNPPLPPLPSSPKLKSKMSHKYTNMKDTRMRDDLMAFLQKTEMANMESFMHNKPLQMSMPENWHSKLEKSELATLESSSQTDDIGIHLTKALTAEFACQTSLKPNCSDSETNTENISRTESSIQTSCFTSEEDSDVQTLISCFENNDYDCPFRNVEKKEFGIQKSLTDIELYCMYKSSKVIATSDFAIQVSPINLAINPSEDNPANDVGTQTLEFTDEEVKYKSPIHVMITCESSTQTSSLSDDTTSVLLASKPFNVDVSSLFSENMPQQPCTQPGLYPSDIIMEQALGKEASLLQSSINQFLMATSVEHISPLASDLSNSPSITLPSPPSSGMASPDSDLIPLSSPQQQIPSSDNSSSPPSLIKFLSPTPSLSPDLHPLSYISVGVQFPLEGEPITYTAPSFSSNMPTNIKATSSVGTQCSLTQSRPTSPPVSTSSILAPLQQISLASMFPSFLASGSSVAAFLMPIDQVDEYTSLKKELEQTAKNCRILQFKLRKSERRAETLETERNEALSNLAAHSGTGVTETQKKLEHELSLANQVSLRLQSEVETLQEKLKEVEEGKKKTGTEEVRKKAPKLAALAKSSSGERPTRESLTRGGSQDDPAQLLRDLQDSMEREADLREQLRFAEEEQSPSPARLTPEPSLEKDEGISEDDDPAELRLQLELNEQVETAVLRRKVEELEKEGETTKKQLKELQDKLAEKKTTPLTAALKDTTLAKGSAISEQKIKVLEEEANELRKKLIEKERDCERLHAELTLTQKRSKGMQRSRSLDSGGGTGTMDQAAFDLKRQLQVVEQEANILRTKTQELESECEKLNAENKKLSLSKATAGKRTAEIKTLRERVKELEAKLESSEMGKGSSGEANKGDSSGKEESDKGSLNVDEMKIRLEKAEAEVEHLSSELKKAKDPKSMLLRKRTAKRPTDLTPKPQMKKMVEELEIEIAELLVVLKNTEAEKTRLAEEIKKKESGKKEISEEAKVDWEKDKAEKEKLAKELEDTKAKLSEAEKEKKKLQKEKAGAEEDLKKKKDEEILKLKESKAKAEQERKKLEKEKVDLEEEVKKLKAEKDSSSNKWEDELKSMAERMDNLRREVEMERSSSDDAKTKLEEMKSAAQKDKAQLDKEVMEKTKKISDMEKKMKETEDKLKKTERFLSNKKEKLVKLEKEVQEEREKSKKLEERQKEVSVGWLKEREELKKESEEAQIKVAELEAQIQLLEGSVQDEQMKTKELQLKVGQSEKESEVVKGLQDDLTALKKQLEEANQKLEKSEKTRKSNEEKLKKAEAEMKKDKGKGKEDHSKEVERLEQELTNERRAYEDLTTKYEMLEEDYVVTKAQLVSEKEAAESQLFVTKHEMDSLDEELETLRDSFNSKQDVWIKEKVDLQERLKEAEEKASRAANNNDTWNAEKNRLRDSLDEKTKEADQLRRESEVINDQINHLRKENEELKSKLEDFDKVVKVQRSMAADTSALEKQLREIKNT